MKRIPEATVRNILDRSDIVQVVGERVRLEPKGGRYWGLCPFHAEKTASFSVLPEKGIFYCFGCHKGGDVITFLRELEKLSYPEALEELAQRAGMTIEDDAESSPEQIQEERERKSLLELNERLTKTFHFFLVQHPTGEVAREVLRKRGITDALRDEFRLGYAPRSKSWLRNFLLKKGYSPGFLAKSGLFAAHHPDFPLFADRLIFPIADPRGRIIAFGGRLLEGEGPKYINSPDTLVFRKQDNLFALDKAGEAIKKRGEALICEGYMDALSFHAAGLKEAVAPLGTSFTERQARLLRRWAERIVFSFDSDEAGQAAAEKAVVLAAATGLESRVAILPGGKDASEILEKEGGGSLQKLPDLTINGGEFLIRRTRELFDIGSVEGKAKAAAFLNPYALALGSDVKRSAFFDMASRELGIRSSHSLAVDYEDARKRGDLRNSLRDRGDRAAGEARGELKRSPDLVFMTAVAVNAELFSGLRSSLAVEDLDDPRARELYIALEECFRAEESGLDALLGRVRGEELQSFLLEAAASGEFAENPERLLQDGLCRIELRGLERRRERILDLMAGGEGEDKSLHDLLYEKMYLDSELARLKGERDERS